LISKAPELFTGGTPDDKTDVYAFGMILWELVAEKYPWEDQLRSLEGTLLLYSTLSF
jgi:serine/threonine protein kinase